MEIKDIVNTVICGDCLEVMKRLPDEVINCVVTSPPYWGLRNYGVDGQIGLEKTPEEFIEKMVVLFREVRRVLRRQGMGTRCY
jgi:DNA modification methylase